MSVESRIPLITMMATDEGFRRPRTDSVRSTGYRSVMFETVATLLNSERLQEIRCLILDIDMPGINDLEVQRQWAEIRHWVPTIVATEGTALRRTSLLRGDSRE